jgi:hypothetical protein
MEDDIKLDDTIDSDEYKEFNTLLINFLVTHGVLFQYINNVRLHPNGCAATTILGIYTIMRERKVKLKNFISHGMAWQGTKEGFDFWADLNTSFNEMYRGSKLYKQIQINSQSLIEFVKLKN